MPLANPVTANGEADPDTDAPPGEAVTVYDVIEAPPVLEGALNATDT